MCAALLFGMMLKKQSEHPERTHLVTCFKSVVFDENVIFTVEMVKLNGMDEKQFD